MHILQAVQVFAVKLVKVLNRFSIVLDAVGNALIRRIDNSQYLVRFKIPGIHHRRYINLLYPAKPFILDSFIHYYGIVKYNHRGKGNVLVGDVVVVADVIRVVIVEYVAAISFFNHYNFYNHYNSIQLAASFLSPRNSLKRFRASFI